MVIELQCSIGQRRIAAWERHLNDLKVFKKTHGHCRVPLHSTTHAAIARWVQIQRRRKKLGTLSEERIRQLNAIGFEWRARQEPA